MKNSEKTVISQRSNITQQIFSHLIRKYLEVILSWNNKRYHFLTKSSFLRNGYSVARKAGWETATKGQQTKEGRRNEELEQEREMEVPHNRQSWIEVMPQQSQSDQQEGERGAQRGTLRSVRRQPTRPGKAPGTPSRTYPKGCRLGMYALPRSIPFSLAYSNKILRCNKDSSRMQQWCKSVRLKEWRPSLEALTSRFFFQNSRRLQ